MDAVFVRTRVFVGGGYQMLSKVSMFEAVRMKLVVTVSSLLGKLILEQSDF